MARRRKASTKMVSFADIEKAVRSVPDEVEKWSKAAHRETWKEFKEGPQKLSLKNRFAQKVDNLGSMRPGHFAQYGLGIYAWSARRRMVPSRPHAHNGQRTKRNNPRLLYARETCAASS